MLKDLQKYVKTHHVIALLGFLVLVIALGQYSSGLGGSMDGMNSMNRENRQQSGGMPRANANQMGVNDAAAVPANPAGQNEVFASAQGVTTSSQGLPPSCAKGPTNTPDDLLPRDVNSEWGRLNPSNNNDLSGVNLLKAGFHAGIDTVGGTLRNANLQVRSEPPNPVVKVSPWMNSTIEPDLMRVPLELGCGPQ